MGGEETYADPLDPVGTFFEFRHEVFEVTTPKRRFRAWRYHQVDQQDERRRPRLVFFGGNGFNAPASISMAVKLGLHWTYDIYSFDYRGYSFRNPGKHGPITYVLEWLWKKVRPRFGENIPHWVGENVRHEYESA